jgi:hypothetical protein
MTRAEAKDRLARPFAASKLEISNPKSERTRMTETAQSENDLTCAKRMKHGAACGIAVSHLFAA